MSQPTDLNLAAPIRLALLDAAPISSALTLWEGEPAIFTRRPVPQDALYPFVVISPDVTISDEDALVARRPIVVRDIVVYGEQPDQYRLVEDTAYRVRALFHRQRFSVIVAGYSVVEIVAKGPMPSPADDLQHIGRMVSLRFRLRDLAT